MKILALDSSGLTASVAIVEDGQLRAEYTVNYKKTHSQTLLPMLDEITDMTELRLQEIEAVAIASGPGSFTGLRIGAATAKGLCLALNVPVIPVPTLEGLAYNLYGCHERICPIMDARRSQVYNGIYTFSAEQTKQSEAPEEHLQVVQTQRTIAVDALIQELNDAEKPVVFLGDGVPVYKEKLEAGLTVPHTYAPEHLNRQRAGAVGALGLRYYKEEKFESAADFKPDYLRVSQAERERAERLAAEAKEKHE